jgi:hypothetical protein
MLPFEALVALHGKLVAEFDRHATAPRWMGMRLIAVDGTKLRLPRLPGIADAFDTQPNGRDDPLPMALLVTRYDVMAGIHRSAELSPCSMDERFLAERLLEHCSPGDLSLYDRGFPSFALFALHTARGSDFCARLTKTYNAQVVDFVGSDAVERIVTLHPSPTARKDCQALGIEPKPVTLRLLRVPLSSGEIEVLATSLLDTQRFPAHLFKDLYARRWAIEESFKALKCLAEVERFRGKSEAAIRLEVHARLITTTLAGMLRFATATSADTRTSERRLRYQINFAAALRKFQHGFIALCRPDASIEMFESFLSWIAADLLPIRPGRSYARKGRKSPAAGVKMAAAGA